MRRFTDKSLAQAVTHGKQLNTFWNTFLKHKLRTGHCQVKLKMDEITISESEAGHWKFADRVKNASKALTVVKERVGFDKRRWVQKEHLESNLRDLFVLYKDEFTELLPKYVVGNYYTQDPSFRHDMTFLRAIVRYAEGAIIRRKVNKRVRTSVWRTSYQYKLCL